MTTMLGITTGSQAAIILQYALLFVRLMVKKIMLVDHYYRSGPQDLARHLSSCGLALGLKSVHAP